MTVLKISFRLLTNCLLCFISFRGRNKSTLEERNPTRGRFGLRWYEHVRKLLRPSASFLWSRLLALRWLYRDALHAFSYTSIFPQRRQKESGGTTFCSCEKEIVTKREMLHSSDINKAVLIKGKVKIYTFDPCSIQSSGFSKQKSDTANLGHRS